MPDPKIEKYERMLHAIPAEFRQLATWGWTELRADIARQAVAAGASRELAAVMASRLARLVVGQMYQDIRLASSTLPRST
ncbi:MAG: hypothetical protein LC750_16760 [Actinobacteria bacterium]|nr:hypothetical protein [Actinomycetota bacterium]